MVGGKLRRMPPRQTSEVQFLEHVATYVRDTLSQLSAIEAQLLQTKQTTRPINTWSQGGLTCTLRVVRYGQRGCSLQAIFERHSTREWAGLQNAGLTGNLQEARRRSALLRRRKRTVTLVWGKSLTIPLAVEARLQARGEDPEAFKALVLEGFRKQTRQRLATASGGKQPQQPWAQRGS